MVAHPALDYDNESMELPSQVKKKTAPCDRLTPEGKGFSRRSAPEKRIDPGGALQ